MLGAVSDFRILIDIEEALAPNERLRGGISCLDGSRVDDDVD